MRKNKIKGFTLMEIIIVIAIIAVLSGVMIPSANYFIRRSKIKTANAEAKVVYNAALTVAQEYEAKNVSVTSTAADGSPSSSVSHDYNNINIPSTRIQKEFVERVDAKVKSDSSDKTVWAVRFSKTGAFPQLTGACASSTFEDRYVGSYPVLAETTGMTYRPFGKDAENVSSLLNYASGSTSASDETE